MPEQPDPKPANQSEPAAASRTEDEDRRLAELLARRGVPPDEIARLLRLGKQEVASSEEGVEHVETASPFDVPMPQELELHTTLQLPDVRECTPEERERAEKLLTQAHLARRRERWGEAERLCLEALQFCPSDAGAVEMLGDICQSVGRVDDALYAYRHALELEPGRRTAEKRYAALRLQQEHGLEALRREAIHRSPLVAVLLSALFPGAGQIYNGQAPKGLVIALLMLCCIYILFWSPWGLSLANSAVSGAAVAFGLVAAGLYIYAVADANLGARRMDGGGKSGWEV